MGKIKSYISFIFKSPNTMFILLWAISAIGYVRGLLLHLPLISGYVGIIIKLIVIIPIVLAIPYIIKDTTFYKGILLYIIICILYLLNGVIYPENYEPLNSNLSRCLFSSFPFLLFGCLIDIKKYYNAFYYASIFYIALDIFYFLIYNSTGVSVSGVEGDHNMGAAYAILPHVLLCISACFRDFKIWKLGVAIIGVIMLLSYGTRGPFFCLLFFITAYLLFIQKIRSKKVFISTIIIATLVFVFQDYILRGLITIIGDYLGMSTRIFDGILDSTIAEDDARSWIVETLISTLNSKNSLFGFGLLGSYNVTGGYPHNFFVDMVFTFGYLIGGILLLLFAFVSIKAYQKSEDTERVFFLILLSSGFMHLMFSGTFVFDADFYLYIGYIIKLLSKK